mgnify:CR=1 FL=1
MVSKTKKYPCVYIDKKDRIYISIELGKDPISGKRVQHKARRTKEGKPFEVKKKHMMRLFVLNTKWKKVNS